MCSKSLTVLSQLFNVLFVFYNYIFQYQNRLEGIKLFLWLFFDDSCFSLLPYLPYQAAWCVGPLESPQLAHPVCGLIPPLVF